MLIDEKMKALNIMGENALTDEDLLTLLDYSEGDSDEDPFSIKEPGWLQFYVVQSVMTDGKWLLEIEIEDLSGCVAWMAEGMGIQFWLEETFNDRDLRTGCRYTIEDITVDFIRGDGWTTDDDEDWDYGPVTESWKIVERVSQIISNWWFFRKRQVSDLWCRWTHGGGDIERDTFGRINWRCRKCGRWSPDSVSLEEERKMTNRAIAAQFSEFDA